MKDLAVRADIGTRSSNSGLPWILIVEDKSILEAREDYSPPEEMASFSGISAAGEESTGGPEKITEAEPKIGINTRSMSFGRVPVRHRISRPLQVSNYGSADLVISYVSILGSGQQSFRPKNTCSVLPPGNTAKILVDFYPNAVGAKMGCLKIYSNDPKEPIIQVNLRGEGQEIGQSQK